MAARRAHLILVVVVAFAVADGKGNPRILRVVTVVFKIKLGVRHSADSYGLVSGGFSIFALASRTFYGQRLIPQDEALYKYRSLRQGP